MSDQGLEAAKPPRTEFKVSELLALVQQGRCLLDCSLEMFMEGLKGDAQAAHGAGGLGFLAGETCGAYKRNGVNAVGCIPGYGTVRKGDSYQEIDWSQSGAVPLTDENSQVVSCDVPMNGGTLKTEFWVVEEGGTPVIMIRQAEVFRVRYPDDPVQKLKQYMFFGRAVVEFCKRLSINPSVLRINEAQLAPVMMAVQRHRETTQQEIGGLLSSTKMVFTNHTQERAALPSWANRQWVEDVIGHGVIPDNAWSELPEHHPMVQADMKNLFLGPVSRVGEGGVKYYQYLSPLNYALHVASAVNMVSAEHGTISREIVFPSQAPDQRLAPGVQKKLLTITNGSERERWTSPALQIQQKNHADAGGSVEDVTGEELLAAREQTKVELNTYLSKNGLPTLEHAAGRPFIALTRRHVEYKEIGTLIPLVRWMCGNSEEEYDVPGGRQKGLGANVLIGGVASDNIGRQWKDEFEALQRDPALNGRFVFAPRTGIEFMRLCTGSSDFWIHGPRQTREACGTSYERAVFSGGWNVCTATGGPMEHIQDGKNGSIVDLFDGHDHELVAQIFDGAHGEDAQEQLVERFESRWQSYLLSKLPELVARYREPGQAAEMAKAVYETSESMDIDAMTVQYRQLYRAVMDGALPSRLADGTLKPAKPFAEPADVQALLAELQPHA